MLKFSGEVEFQKILWRGENSVLFSAKTIGEKGFFVSAFCDSVFSDKLESASVIELDGILTTGKVKNAFREDQHGIKKDVWGLNLNVKNIIFKTQKEYKPSGDRSPYNNVVPNDNFASDEIPF